MSEISEQRFPDEQAQYMLGFKEEETRVKNGVESRWH
jgi:hypothetical protein